MGSMEMSDAHALNRVILSLYHEGREVPLGSFQAWALEQLQYLIAFDSAWWGNAAAKPPVLFLSGPEGGLSAHEDALARAHGFAPISLGARILRAETAPLAVLAWAGLAG